MKQTLIALAVASLLFHVAFAESSTATFSVTLGRGSTDLKTQGQVSLLQKMLAKDKAIYPEGVISGYFGPATERAVQRWQKKHNIVSSGTPQSTGYGIVGKRTRAAMNAPYTTGIGTAKNFLVSGTDISLPVLEKGNATTTSLVRVWYPNAPTSTKITVTQKGPSGVTFKPAECMSYPCQIQPIVSVASTISPGKYPITVSASLGKEVAESQYFLTILPPQDLEVAFYASKDIFVSRLTNSTVAGANSIIVKPIKGTGVKIKMTQSGLPHGVTGKTDFGYCTIPCTIANSLSVSSAAVSGTYPITVHIVGEGVDRTLTYNLSVTYIEKFGYHFEGATTPITQNQNPTARIEIDYPFTLYLDGGTVETVKLSTKAPNASTSVAVAPAECTFPCNAAARITLLPGMKVGTYTATINAVVTRHETDTKGLPKDVDYKKTWNITVKIVALPTSQ